MTQGGLNPGAMSLGLVIPVHNDQAALQRLLTQAREFGIFDQIVVVDDGSEPPVAAAAASPEANPDTDTGFTLLRNARAQGPGPARNRAIEQLTTSHVLFFDSDDLLTPELPRLWRELQGATFDFCLFSHADSRRFGAGHWGQMPQDSAFWHAAATGGPGAPVGPGPRPLPPEAAAILAQTANYPWNKIYRTGFLHQPEIRCSDILVHEDIELHWMSFLHAGRILVSDRVAAIHHVDPGGARLTNRRGAERLAVFGPLDRIWQALNTARGSGDRSALAPAFLCFVSGLFDWMRDHLVPELHGALDKAMRDFLCQAITPQMQARLIARDPVLALRLALQMAGGRVPC